jgi:hypothetical protein
MWIYVATLVGGAVFVIGWATSLGSDVSGLIWLGFIGLGILGHMAERRRQQPADDAP